MSKVLRVIDANANRAREALRVMEDAARFVLDDGDLARELKTLRHDLAGALTGAGLNGLAGWRDTPGDVGTQITTAAEAHRAGVREVAVAAGKRLSEALRSVEEYAKTLPLAEPPASTDTAASPGSDAPGSDAPGNTPPGDAPLGPEATGDADASGGGVGRGLPGRVEALRYRGYELERRLSAAWAGGRARQWRVCVLVTESGCRLPWREVVERVLDAGADCVQLREKELEGGALLERAGWLAERCRAAGAASVINDRPDLAVLSGADAVHVGQGDLPVAAVRRLAGRRLLVGVSTGDLGQASRARADGADYVGVGPMFATTTKHKPELAGPAYLRAFLDGPGRTGLAHLAIGGITTQNLPTLVEAGARGVAVSAAVCGAADPGAVVRAMRERLDRAAGR
ncbi:MAG: thiamine phosphate synthase [Planctomycetota bacterium]